MSKTREISFSIPPIIVKKKKYRTEEKCPAHGVPHMNRLLGTKEVPEKKKGGGLPHYSIL